MAKKIKGLKTRTRIQKKKMQPNRDRNLSFQSDLLQQAVALHQAGRLREAETLYRQLLATEPDHPAALNFLGLLAHQAGKDEIALDLINRALSSKADYVDAHVNLGVIYSDLGKSDQAIASYRKALALKPDYPEIYSNLGNLYRDQGRLDEAAACFRKALDLKPDFAGGHFNLGNVLKDMGSLDEAIISFQQAISLQPDYAEALNNMGNAYHDLGKLDEAAASFRKILELKPDFAGGHFNLGNVLKDMGRLDEAIVSFQQAINLQPDYAEASNGLGLAFRELGRMDEARSSFRKALAIKPDYIGAFQNLTTTLKFTGTDQTVTAMENLYHLNRDISESGRVHLCFALGKVFEDLGNYGKSFKFITEANRLKRKTYDYTIQSDIDLFERIKKTFSPDFFAARRSSVCRDKTPVFILGMPRAGTTLVEQILASHPQVYGAGELAILTHLARSLCPEAISPFPDCVPELESEALDEAGSAYIHKIREYSGEAEYITDKMPDNFQRIGLIRAILPHAKVIHCLRDPMDTCFSIFKNEFEGRHYYAYDMTELGHYYKLYQDLMAHWEQVLPGFMHTIRYEELVADQETQTKRLLDYCNLPWDEACLAFHRTTRRVTTASLAQVRQPMYRDSIKLWRLYEKGLGPLKKAIYGQ